MKYGKGEVIDIYVSLPIFLCHFTEYDFWNALIKRRCRDFAAWNSCFPTITISEVLKRKLRDNNLEHTLHNLPAGDWAAGER